VNCNSQPEIVRRHVSCERKVNSCRPPLRGAWGQCPRARPTTARPTTAPHSSEELRNQRISNTPRLLEVPLLSKSKTTLSYHSRVSCQPPLLRPGHLSGQSRANQSKRGLHSMHFGKLAPTLGSVDHLPSHSKMPLARRQRAHPGEGARQQKQRDIDKDRNDNKSSQGCRPKRRSRRTCTKNKR
jgi:hypothetical protein